MIWLTGASGYVGTHVLPRLIARTGVVRCLVLPDDPAALVEQAKAEVVRGDLTKLETFAHAGEGIDTIVHLASLMLPNPADRIERVNVDGTANLLRFAERWGIKRFVYVSAVSAVYAEKNVYGRSKARAEQMVSASGLAHTILRPTMIYGRGGGHHFKTVADLVARAPGVVPVVGSGRARLQPVWIDDVVEAVDLALARPAAVGKSYNVSGTTIVTLDELVRRIAAAMGVRRVIAHVPFSLCLAAAHLVSRITERSVLSPDALRGANQDAALDYGPFQQECGYAPISLDDGLARVFARR